MSSRARLTPLVAPIVALLMGACSEPGSVEGHVVAAGGQAGVDGAQVVLLPESRETDSVISPVCNRLAKLSDVAAHASDSDAFASPVAGVAGERIIQPIDDSLRREVIHFSNAAASLQSIATYTDERGYFEFRRVTPGAFLVVAFYSSGPSQMTWVSRIVAHPRDRARVTLDGGSHLALGSWCRNRVSRVPTESR